MLIIYTTYKMEDSNTSLLVPNLKFLFNGEHIHIFGPPNDLWICIIEALKAFGYKDTGYVKRIVGSDNKDTLKNLLEKYFSTNLDVDPTNKKMLYMNEAGLLQILAKTKSADARFYGEKILQLLEKFKTGTYEYNGEKIIKHTNEKELDQDGTSDSESNDEVKEPELKLKIKSIFRENNLEDRRSDEQVAQNIFDTINRAFTYSDKQIRTIAVNDEVWFCGKDIAEILEYKNTEKAIEKHVDIEDKKSLKELQTMLLTQCKTQGIENFNKRDLIMIYINESGLYSLILRSKLPTAKQFKNYITKTLLPSMRKVGQQQYLEQIALLKLEQEKHQQILKEKEEELKKKETENKWLYLAAQKKVSFEKRESEKGFIYTGYHANEKNSQIKKMGETERHFILREMEHSSSSSDLNAFEMKSYYPSFISEPTEYWLQKLLDPLQVKTDNADNILDKSRDKLKKRKKKEHFLINQDILDFVIKRVINCESEVVQFINNYITLLDQHDMNFDVVDEKTKDFITDFIRNMDKMNISYYEDFKYGVDKIIDDFCDDDILKEELYNQITKELETVEFPDLNVSNNVQKCKGINGCSAYLPLTSFEIKSGTARKSMCINCVNQKCQMKCRGECGETKKGSAFSINAKGLRNRRCDICMSTATIIYKTCKGACGEKKPNSEFDTFENDPKRRKNKCRACMNAQ